MDRAKFFSALRGSLYKAGLPQSAVTALDAILDECMKRSLVAAHVAYTMATAFHEVGSALIPVRENLTYSSAARLRAVWPSRFKSDAAAAPYVRNPQKLANFVYGGRLGNTGPNDGWLYRGGGFPQTTGKENYQKVGRVVGVDLVGYPDRITEPRIAVAALVAGMVQGFYTGRSLASYSLPQQYREARAIINADVGTNGERIAGYARSFEAALRAAGYGTGPAPQPKPPTYRPAPVLDHVPVTKDDADEAVKTGKQTAGIVVIIIGACGAAVYAIRDGAAGVACDWINLFCGG